VLLALAIVLVGAENSEARTKRGSRRTVVVAKKQTKSTSSKRKAKRSRRSRRVRIRTTPTTALSAVREFEVSSGVRYAEYRSNGSMPVNVHVVAVDRTEASNAIRLIKGEDSHDGLESLADLARRYAQQNDAEVLGVVNANFWRALRNTPIGPCVIDGEVVELLPYKQWSSAFFDVEDRVTIDTFRLEARLSIGNSEYRIASVNRRIDSGIVVYNRYAGGTIPHVQAREIERAYKEAAKDSLFMEGDSTEIALSQEVLRTEIAKAQREASQEYPMIKIRLRYLRSPAINTVVPCEVLGVDTGAVDVPLRGCILSFPQGALQRIPRSGESISIRYSTNLQPTAKFMNAVCGTPRLVRNGIASHEALREGSTGRRFITHNLARTALGTDRSSNRIVFVAVEPSQTAQGTMGATLAQMATIMKLLGCFNAMNLDGGGSTGMVVKGDHVFFEGEDPKTRRISVGLAVVKRSHVLRSILGGGPADSR
jgi:Phosphodiester glycosidase